MKKIALLILASLLTLSTYQYTSVIQASADIQNPYEMRVARDIEPESVDPAWARYDPTSELATNELISNVYETLIRYDGESTDEFIPWLATEWTESEDSGLYTFMIREDVHFHNGDNLTAEDVGYSIERAMIMDVEDGKAWMLLEPLIGEDSITTYDLTDPVIAEHIGLLIDDSVDIDGGTVVFHLQNSDKPFLSALAHSLSSILSKSWCEAHGEFPGFEETGHVNWVEWNNPEASNLDLLGPIMMGTGPYMLDYWEIGNNWSILRFEDYWRPWPAPENRGWIENVTMHKINDWSLRRDAFFDGEYDILDVSSENIGEILEYMVYNRREIRGVYPSHDWPENGRFERFWVHGHYTFNPMEPGIDFYYLWKEEIPGEDVNLDGVVDDEDAAEIRQRHGSYWMPGLIYPDYTYPSWNPRADVNGDSIVSAEDERLVAKMFATAIPPWVPPAMAGSTNVRFSSEQPSTEEHNTIYIRSDGSVDPDDGRIVRDGDVYTLTENISEPIVVERDNTVLDGNEHAVTCPSCTYGINVTRRYNVTVQSFNVIETPFGISLEESNTCLVKDSEVIDGLVGIYLYYSDNCVVTRNTLINNTYGVDFSLSTNTSISENWVSNGEDALWGIVHQFQLLPFAVTMSENCILTPMIHAIYSGGTGVNILGNIISSADILVSGGAHEINDNRLESGGITLTGFYSTIIGNTITNDKIELNESHFNIIIYNEVRSANAVSLRNSNNSEFYNNNFFGEVNSVNSINQWDGRYFDAGNYWDGYDGVDEFSGLDRNIPGSDGIIDEPYVIDENNKDNYPMIKPYALTDINYDGRVNILDISRAAQAFGSAFECFCPGCLPDTRWDIGADINIDGVVNILDIALIAMDFGWVAPPR